jgi:endonuclease/exonuclease/phosphatase family metal-dependent hydrolase
MDCTRTGGIAFVAAVTAALATTAFAERPAGALKVATHNINWGNVDLETMANTIRQADADVVCLQETNEQSEQYIRRTLKKAYSEIYFHGHQGRLEAERLGFLSRHQITRLLFVEPKHGLFGAYIAHVKTQGTTIQIVNVHLQPVILPRNSGLRQALSAFAAMEQTHSQEIRHILESVEPDVPTVIAGDFNSLSEFQAPSFLRKKGFVDSFAQIHDNPDSQPTWRWRLRSGEWSLRLDYIFHSQHLKTTESIVIRCSASDHYLVTSVLQPSEGVGKQEEQAPAAAARRSEGPPD